MTSPLYEEVLPGSYYCKSRSKKLNRDDMLSSQPDEDFNCHPKTSSYISRIKTTYNSNIPTVLECSESLSEQEPETVSATLEDDRDAETEQLVILVDENLSAREKTEPFKQSVLQVPCKNIKDYRDNVKQASAATLDMFPPPAVDPGNSMDQIEKERREVEDAIERYTQARICASFENFLQEKKPCYVEKCGFHRVASPDLVGSSRETSQMTECPSQPTDVYSRSQILLEDACDEDYDRINGSIAANSCKSYLQSRNMSSHTKSTFSSPNDVMSAGCDPSYTAQIGSRRHDGRGLQGLGYVDVVNCSQSMLSPSFPSYMMRSSFGDDDDEDDDDDDDDEEYDDDEDDDEEDDYDDVIELKLREFPKISEC